MCFFSRVIIQIAFASLRICCLATGHVCFLASSVILRAPMRSNVENRLFGKIEVGPRAFVKSLQRR